jgi:hypothetical protein
MVMNYVSLNQCLGGGLGVDSQRMLATGVAIFIGAIVYDWVDGNLTIEEKRTRARYKYGRQIHKKNVP